MTVLERTYETQITIGEGVYQTIQEAAKRIPAQISTDHLVPLVEEFYIFPKGKSKDLFIVCYMQMIYNTLQSSLFGNQQQFEENRDAFVLIIAGHVAAFLRAFGAKRR